MEVLEYPPNLTAPNEDPLPCSPRMFHRCWAPDPLLCQNWKGCCCRRRRCCCSRKDSWRWYVSSVTTGDPSCWKTGDFCGADLGAAVVGVLKWEVRPRWRECCSRTTKILSNFLGLWAHVVGAFVICLSLHKSYFYIKLLSVPHSMGLAAPGYVKNQLSVHLCLVGASRATITYISLHTYRSCLPRPFLLSSASNQKVCDRFDTGYW